MKMLVVLIIASVLLLYGCTQNAANTQDAMEGGAQAGAGSTMPAKGEELPGTGTSAGQVDSEGQVGGDAAAAGQAGPVDGNGIDAGEAKAGEGTVGSDGTGASNAGNEGAGAGNAGAMGAVKEFTIEAVMWDFSPKTITVNKGDTVRITLVNKDVSHGIGIREFNFSLKADAGQTATGEFVADKEGSYKFFCNIFCGEGHREMAGTLVVK